MDFEQMIEPVGRMTGRAVDGRTTLDLGLREEVEVRDLREGKDEDFEWLETWLGSIRGGPFWIEDSKSTSWLEIALMISHR